MSDRSRSRSRNSRSQSRGRTNQVFVTRISRRTSSQDLKDAFRKYGHIKNVSMKRSYAFVEFSNSEDARYGIKYKKQPLTE